MPQIPPNKKHLSRRSKAIVLVVAGVVLVGLGGLVWKLYDTSQKRAEEQAFQKAISSANDDANLGRYDSAATDLLGYINKYHSNQPHLVVVESKLGGEYLNMERYGDASKWFRKSLDDNGPLTLQLSNNIARAAQLSGDKATARKYFTESLKYYEKSTSSDSQIQIDLMKKNIEALN